MAIRGGSRMINSLDNLIGAELGVKDRYTGNLIINPMSDIIIGEGGKSIGWDAQTIAESQTAYGMLEIAAMLWQASLSPRQARETMSPYDLEPTHNLTMVRNKFNEFVKQIGNEGINEPIKFVEYNNTKFIVDGHHRVMAAKILGIKSVPVEEVTLPFKGYTTMEDLFFQGENYGYLASSNQINT